jgi:eukaryotic-like serine/threonine-protein kinase
MGRVYRAYDPNLAREVALKVLQAPVGGGDQARFAARFQREAVALAKLRHPHIVAVHDYGTDDGVAFVVMELVAGRPLGALLADDGALTLDRTMHIAGQLAAALAYAHERGIVHRDVKPDNVVIEPGDFVRLIDFGLACVADSNLTLGAFVVGTPNYLSPEAATSKPIDHRSDQFSLATVIFEMLTGQRVFRGASLEGTVRNICIMSPPTLADLGIVAPTALQALLAQMHAKDPAARVQSDAELLQRLVALGA